MTEPNEISLSRQSESVAAPSLEAWSVTSWQSEADVPLRRTVCEKIMQLCRGKYSRHHQDPITAEFQQKLPGFVKAVEEVLYAGAATKEEYADQVSLESRIMAANKQLIIAKERARDYESQSMSSSLGIMMPTPGFAIVPSPGSTSVSGVASGMMRIPGSGGTMVPTPETVSMVRLMEDPNLGSEDQ